MRSTFACLTAALIVCCACLMGRVARRRLRCPFRDRFAWLMPRSLVPEYFWRSLDGRGRVDIIRMTRRRLASRAWTLQPPGPFDAPDRLVVQMVKVTSHDGVLVPLTIVRQQGVALDASNPAILAGYGAYGFSFEPYFDPRWLAWLERGGVYAIAHVRGGGGYGEERR